MEKCYEYLGCSQTDCNRHGVKDAKFCWEVENTQCNHHGIAYIRNHTIGPKVEACEKARCLYFMEARMRRLV